jgi:hypothetical protein
MSDYERSIVVQAHPDKIFDFVSKVENVPQYLPTVQKAELQSGDRIRVRGEVAGHTYDNDGYFRADKEARRLEWGSDGEKRYSGWLQVEQMEDPSTAKVIAHIAFAMSDEQQQKFAQPSGDPDAAFNEGIDKALQSIKNICEGHGGKVESQTATRKQ